MRRRFRQFAANAGVWGIGQVVGAFLVLGWLIATETNGVLRALVLVALVLGGLFGRLIRPLILRQPRMTAIAMNVLAVAGIVAYLALRNQPISGGAVLAMMFGIGCYLSCYFWLLSDPYLAFGKRAREMPFRVA